METRSENGNIEYLCDDCEKWVGLVFLEKENGKIKQICKKCKYKK